MKTLVLISAAVLTLTTVALVPGCTIGTATEGEGEGSAGEGEGEGEGDTPIIDVGAPPFGFQADATATHCSTRQIWVNGEREDFNMHPGVNCIQCHTTTRGPDGEIGGTVMGSLHDVDDCRGIPDVTVDIIGSDGTVVATTTTGESGNIFGSLNGSGLAGVSPYTIKLTYQGRSVSMVTPQTDGNCMSCHTAAGANGAPGRVIVP